MPFMMVWTDSCIGLDAERWILAARRARPADIFSLVSLCFRLNRDFVNRCSQECHRFQNQQDQQRSKVYPGCVSFRTLQADNVASPCFGESLHARWRASSFIRPTRSFLPLVEFKSVSPWASLPE